MAHKRNNVGHVIDVRPVYESRRAFVKSQRPIATQNTNEIRGAFIMWYWAR